MSARRQLVVTLLTSPTSNLGCTKRVDVAALSRRDLDGQVSWWAKFTCTSGENDVVAIKPAARTYLSPCL